MRSGIIITRQGRVREPFSAEHREKISKSSKGRTGWCKGKKMPKDFSYLNMKNHLRFNVTLEWLSQFDDIEKLKFLNKAITNRDNRWDNDTAWYKNYIEKFYFDAQFNNLYQKYLLKSDDKYLKPSVDHIVPKSAGGTDAVENLCFLSWFENRAKNDMPLTEWNVLKSNIHEYLI